jgi:hypothetical protein
MEVNTASPAPSQPPGAARSRPRADPTCESQPNASRRTGARRPNRAACANCITRGCTPRTYVNSMVCFGSAYPKTVFIAKACFRDWNRLSEMPTSM